MKVLMVNTPASVRFRGGDLTQMRKTAESLRHLGVEVAESFDPRPNPAGFDLAHVFNLRTVQVTPGQVKALKQHGVPVVMSPIYLNPSLATWGTRVIDNIFQREPPDDKLRRLLDGLSTHKLVVKRTGGVVLEAHAQNRSRSDYDRLQRETLERVDHLLPNSFLEMHEMVRTLRMHHHSFSVVPYAADALTFLDPDPQPFIKRYKVRDFVLQVGRIELSKNQLLLVYALRDAALPVVLIGGSLQGRYLDWCVKYGPRNLKIIPHLPAAELASAYAAARVHALPSWIETCGLVTMEAALANCSVVASTAGYELEYFQDLAYYCDPADPSSIRAAVTKAMENYDRDAPRRMSLKQLVMTRYTWERVGDATFRAYCRVLGR